MGEETKRTNVRLSPSLHFALKSAAIKRHTTIDEIIRSAIVRELSSAEEGSSASYDLDASKGDLLELQQQLDYCSSLVAKCLSPQTLSSRQFLRTIAARFLCCLPAPTVITDEAGVIHWQNPIADKTFGTGLESASLSETDYGLEAPDWREEDLTTATRAGNLPFRVCHFSFRASSEDELLWYGRVLIPLKQYEDANECPQFMPVCSSEALGKAIQTLSTDVAFSFLNAFPTTATVKETSGALRWYNSTFQRLSGARTSDGALGAATTSLIDLPDNAVREHEELALRQKLGVMAKESIGKQIRRNVRFPIFDDAGQVCFIGAISTQQPPVSLDPTISVDEEDPEPVDAIEK